MIATFVGARVLARRRELALLKAAGFTPRQLMLLALLENLVIGAGAALVGVAPGATAAPRATVENTARAAFAPPVARAGLAPAHADPIDVPDLGRDQVRPIVWA